MRVITSRFGPVEVDSSRLMFFARGILGFPKYKKYALIQPEQDSAFYWLQSVEVPDLAFVVAHPNVIEESYAVPMTHDLKSELDVQGGDDIEVLVIVNFAKGALTANFQGPLVINRHTFNAAQIVINGKRYQTRQPIAHAAAPTTGGK